MTSAAQRNANLLLLISALLVQTIGTGLQIITPSWGLILTEFLLILAPVLLLLRRQGLPPAPALGLRWPGALPVLLGALTGLGTFAAGVLLAAFVFGLAGYVPPSPANPTAPLPALAVLLAMTVAAPLCEESFFRGYVFGAYLERGARVAIPVTALLFAFFHMRFAGLAGLLPVAFALSFVRWRSDSLFPGIAMHVVHNFMGTGPALSGVLIGHPLTLSVPLLEGCLLIGGVAFILFSLTVRPERKAALQVAAAAGPAPAQPAGRVVWPSAWPLVAFGCIYVAIAVVEVLSGSGRLPSQPLQLSAPASWSQAHHWRYEVRNVAQQKIGDLDCRLEPTADQINLTCTGAAGVTRASWRRSDMQLLAMTAPGGTPPSLTLPSAALVGGEWPWRLMASPFRRIGSTTAAFATPGGVQKTAIKVLSTGGSMRVMGRDFVTIVVQVGDREEVTYASGEAHTLLRYTNGTETYVLTGDE